MPSFGVVRSVTWTLYIRILFLYERTMSVSFSYDPLDDATDCDHKTDLQYGGIIRYERDADTTECFSLEGFKGPPEPDQHPILSEKLEEWRQNALKYSPAKYAETINFFAKNLTHVSHSDFLSALQRCFQSFAKLYPPSEFIAISDTSLKSKKSDRWVEDLAIRHGFFKIPERQIARREKKKTHAKKKLYYLQLKTVCIQETSSKHGSYVFAAK